MNKALMLLAGAINVLGCESIYIPPCTMGQWADQIFIGTVVRENGTFHVDEPIKGIALGTKVVQAGLPACMLSYEVGPQEYLVLVHHQEGIPVPGTIVERLEDAAKSIDLFRALARGEHRTVIYGQIGEDMGDELVRFRLNDEHAPGLAGVQVTASKDGREFTGFTDFSGTYSVNLPEPGKYSVVTKLDGHEAAKPSYDLDVAPDSCRELNVGMWTASRLSGRITDAGGRPAAAVRVGIEAASEAVNFRSETKTDAEGRYEFTKIPKGDYVVGVNMHGLDSKNPYDVRFYSGAAERAGAQVIKVGGAGSTGNLDFQIGDRKPTRRIAVQLVWPDGKPVINASIDCGSLAGAPIRDLIFRYVDLGGEATCEMLADEDVQVTADRLTWSSSGRPVQPVTAKPSRLVQAGTDTVLVRLVLDSVNDISAREAPMNLVEFNDKESN